MRRIEAIDAEHAQPARGKRRESARAHRAEADHDHVVAVPHGGAPSYPLSVRDSVPAEQQLREIRTVDHAVGVDVKGGAAREMETERNRDRSR